MPGNDNDLGVYTPLTPVVFEILLVLADGARHGYAIMQEVNRRSEGRVGLGPGTLYGAIQRMEDAGLLEKADPPSAGEKPQARRRYYAMTDIGRTALLRETDRMESLVTFVRQKDLGSTPTAV